MPIIKEHRAGSKKSNEALQNCPQCANHFREKERLELAVLVDHTKLNEAERVQLHTKLNDACVTKAKEVQASAIRGHLLDPHPQD